MWTGTSGCAGGTGGEKSVAQSCWSSGYDSTFPRLREGFDSPTRYLFRSSLHKRPCVGSRTSGSPAGGLVAGGRSSDDGVVGGGGGRTAEPNSTPGRRAASARWRADARNQSKCSRASRHYRTRADANWLWTRLTDGVRSTLFSSQAHTPAPCSDQRHDTTSPQQVQATSRCTRRGPRARVGGIRTG